MIDNIWTGYLWWRWNGRIVYCLDLDKLMHMYNLDKNYGFIAHTREEAKKIAEENYATTKEEYLFLKNATYAEIKEKYKKH
jgi:hypothetical protein